MKIQLIGVESWNATIRKDGREDVRMSWSVIHELQQQTGGARYVYRWIMAEFCRCSRLVRLGKPWESPEREVSDIVREMRSKDDTEASKIALDDQNEWLRKARESEERARWDELDRVRKERSETTEDDPWYPIHSWDIPHDKIRFDVPKCNQGQIVEVAYGTGGRATATELDPYKRITDQSRSDDVRYYEKRYRYESRNES